jgi:hypothetical protein
MGPIVVSSVLCTPFPAGAGAATLGGTYLPQTQARTPEGTALALSVAGGLRRRAADDDRGALHGARKRDDRDGARRRRGDVRGVRAHGHGRRRRGDSARRRSRVGSPASAHSFFP